jgi:ABC-type multidrug transport system ATPase subunit
MTGGIIFSADSVGKRFGSRVVLRAASVWGRAGCLSVLLGRNGCGKTTLLRVAAGLTPADHGVVRYGDRAYTRPRLHVLAGRGLFYLPQDGLLPRWEPLHQQIAAVEWRFGRAPAAAEALAGLEIGALLDAAPHELSGGEQRRAAIALAILRQPGVLLADEPLTGIAPVDAERITSALRGLAGTGAAIIATGHETAALLHAADDVIWMTAGTTHGLGAPAAALRHDQFRREYLGLPAAPASSVQTGE